MTLSFKLADTFINTYATKPVDWGYQDAAGNSLGEITFLRTYSRIKPDGTKEKWHEVCRRVIEWMYSEQKQHCFTGDTRLITRDGVVALEDVVGTSVEVMSAALTKDKKGSKEGRWVSAEVRSFEVQNIWEVTLRRGNDIRVIRTTSNHRWIAKKKSGGSYAFGFIDTEQLAPGMVLGSLTPRSNLRTSVPSPFGAARGIVFGDGALGGRGSSVTLWGDKDLELLPIFSGHNTTDKLTPNGVRGVEVRGLPAYFKTQLPSLDESVSYLYGWLAGYFAADGTVTGSGCPMLYSAKRANLEFVQRLALRLGIAANPIRTSRNLNSFANNEHIMYSVSFVRSTVPDDFFILSGHREAFTAAGRSERSVGQWAVESVRATDDQEEVFCPVVPGNETFALEDFIWVGNCKANRLPWNDHKAQRSAQDAYDRMFHFKWTPPGRGLWIAGTPLVTEQRNSAALQNCFRGTETILTRDGIQTFAELLDQSVEVWTATGWTKAEVKSFGKQPVQRITFSPAVPARNGSWRSARSNQRVDVVATPNHRWELIDGTVTTALNIGDIVPAAAADTANMDIEGFRHGLIFADGSVSYRYKNGDISHILRLCGKKAQYVGLFETVHYQPNCNGDPTVYHRSPENFKELPSGKTTEYIGSFIKGWLAGDGSQQRSSVALSTQNSDAVNWLLENAACSGYVVTGHTIAKNMETTYGKRHAPLHKIILANPSNRAWRVVGIERLPKTELVSCAVVPGVERFTLGSGIYTANCAFASTGDMTKVDPSAPFKFIMEALMLGVGVGFDDKGADKEFIIYEPGGAARTFVIPDTREGWVDSLGVLLESYLMPDKAAVEFDYSLVRPAGEPIKTFGGVAAGPGPLRELHNLIRNKFSGRAGSFLSRVDIADIGNQIGVCVVSGNVRRSAMLLLGRIDDKDFISLKNPKVFPERNYWSADDTTKRGWGWMSNNSVEANVASQYDHLIEGIALNGEPGIVWMDTTRAYSRLIDPPDNKDWRVAGVNPCSEQSLESEECCTLVETYLNRHDSLEDFQKTLKFAFMYAKTVTLLPTHWERTNAIMQRNRRIGCSISGVANFVDNRGLPALRTWLDKGYETVQRYDRVYSEWLGIRQSIKTTTVKPSGCRPWDALTSTAQGVLTLEELFTASGHREGRQWQDFSGYRALQGGGKSSPVVKTYDNGKAEVYGVNLSYGMQVRSTGNHRWWVVRHYDHTAWPRSVEVGHWVATDRLRPGDVLEVRPGVYSSTHEARLLPLDSRAISMREDATEIRQPAEMNADLGWLLGYLWGDGAQSPGKYRIRFSDERLRNIEKAQRILVEQFAVQSTIERASGGRNCYALDVGSKMLWHWFIKNGVWKYFADDIDCIPEVVRRSSITTLLAFLAGLVDADGHVAARQYENVVIMSTASAGFARHVQDVALAAGIVFGRSHNTRGLNKQARKSMWLMGLAPETVPERLDVMASYSTKMTNPKHDLPWSPHRRGRSRTRILGKVQSVESLGEMDTFDIEVADTHWYYAGGIKSHNTVSILAGESPGVHWAPGGAYFNRAIRLAKDDVLVPLLTAAGYTVEPDVRDREHTVVAYFPIHTDAKRAEGDVTIFEKANLAVVAQRYWSDNSVSVTLSFDAEKEAQHVGTILHMHEGQLKTVSFLPMGNTVYPQQPYTKITPEQYEAAGGALSKIDLEPIYRGDQPAVDAVGERYCTTDTCELKQQ